MVFVILLVGVIAFFPRCSSEEPNKSLSKLGEEPQVGIIYYICTSTPIGEFPMTGEIVSYRPAIINEIFVDSMGIKFVNFRYYNPSKPDFEQDTTTENVRYDEFIRYTFKRPKETLII
jgi:hypothetical protein